MGEGGGAGREFERRQWRRQWFRSLVLQDSCAGHGRLRVIQAYTIHCKIHTS